MHRKGLATSALVGLVLALSWGAGRAVAHDAGVDRLDKQDKRDKTLYIWAGDQARVRPDFLAVIDFNERSATYGRVIRTVPLPPPGNVGNEPHHCHLSAD